MVLASLSFAVMQSAVKATPEVSVFQKVFVRNLVSLVIAFVLIRRHGGRPWGTGKKSRILLLFRSLFGLLGVFLIFFAIEHLSVADASVFIRLCPFWVVLLSALFLSESLTIPKVVSLLLASLGTIIIVQPGFASEGDTAHILAVVLGVIASFCAGVAYLLVSILKSYEKPATIVFVFSLFSVIAMFPFVLSDERIPQGDEVALLLLIGLSAAAGQLFLTTSYRLGKASEVSIYNYSGIVFAVCIDIFLFQTIPSFFTILGALCITVAGIVVYYGGRKEN